MQNKKFHSGFISIIGRPNVGKSALLNRFLQEKIAIVSDKPQTTRNRILGVKHRADGQMVFLDTPGIHKPKYKLNQMMVQVARATLEEVDLIFFVAEATDAPRFRAGGSIRAGGDLYIMDWLKEIKTPVFLVLNKIDLIKKEQTLPMVEVYCRQFPFAEVVPVSALTGGNTDRLLDIAATYLPEGEPFFPEDTVTDQPVRFIASELIREKILHHTREEIPYSVAVLIEEFVEEKDRPTHIRATLLVERESQKGILIGKSGEMLKTVGKEARLEIERLLGTKLFLELWVKVEKNWRQDEALLSKLVF